MRHAVRGHRRRGVTAAALAAFLLAACSSTSPKPSPTTTAVTTVPGPTTTTLPGSSPGEVEGPEGVPIPGAPLLAGVDTAQYPQTIDGIQCNTSEQLVYHIHAHLTIFVNGAAQQIPYGIGIAPPLETAPFNGANFVDGGVCFYWLHTHASDGIIHIESPTQTIYTLGQFFDVWGQPLTSGQVGPAKGQLTMFVDGQPYTGDPRAIQLTAHNQIQLDVGTPAPLQTLITFPAGL